MIGLIRKFKSKYLWNKKEKDIIEFIHRNDFKLSERNGYIGVLVSPWMKTLIPWYSIALGLLLKKKYKKEVLFIVDDLPFSTERLNPSYQIQSIKKVSQILSEKNNVIYLSEQSLVSVPEKIIENYTYYNTVHDIKTEQFTKENEYFNLINSQLKRSAPKILTLIESNKFDYLVIPGGLCLTSGIFHKLAEEKKIRVVSYDSGMGGSFLLSTDGVAAHLNDIPRAVETVFSSEKFDFEKIEQDVLSLVNDRLQGKDVFKSQLGQNDTDMDFSNSVLLPLNVNWDSAALNKHKIFQDTIEWITDTTKWILENTNKNIIIRQHPVERFDYGKSCDDYETILFEIFGKHSRVIFIGAEDKVNTYDILEQTDLVITHTSTVATEAVISGVNVITVSSVYYSQIGFVSSPNTKEAYYEKIKSTLDAQPEINMDKYKKAIVTYFVSQRLNWFFPGFLPSHEVGGWICLTLDEIFMRNGVKEIVEAIEQNIPISIVNYRDNHDSN